MNDLVVGALEKGGVNRTDRAHAVGGHAGREKDRVLLRDAHVEELFRQLLFQMVQAGPGRHGGGDAGHPPVLPGQLYEGAAGHVLVLRRGVARTWLALARTDVEGTAAVKTLRLLQRHGIALALGRESVDEDGLLRLLGEFEVVLQLLVVVPVDRADVAHAEFLEERGGDEKVLGFLFPLRAEMDEGFAARNLLQKGLEVVVQTGVDRVGDKLVEVAGDGPDVAGDRPLVVVEDNDETPGGGSHVVERLHGDPAGEGGVAADRHNMLFPATTVARYRHAQRRRERGAGMSGAKGVVRALTAGQETTRAPAAPQLFKKIAGATRQQLVRVALMGHVENHFVAGRFKRPVQGQRQFDHTEVGSDVPPVCRGHPQKNRAELLRQFREPLTRQTLQVVGRLDLVQQRHGGRFKNQIIRGRAGPLSLPRPFPRQARSRRWRRPTARS